MSIFVTMADLVIKNGLVLRMDGSPIEMGVVVVEGGIITRVGGSRGEKADRAIDAGGCLVMPGLINTHTHLSMTLLRGYADDLPLQEFLGKLWQVEGEMTNQDVRIGALLGCLEMIRSGTTSFADMYIHMGEVAQVVEKAGLRGGLAFGTIDRGDWEEKLRVREGFVRDWNGKSGRISAMYACHSPATCSPELLTKIREMASRDKVMIQIHASETSKEIEMLDRIGFLGPDVLAAHCIWLREKDMDLLKKHQVKVSYNPTSNMKLSAGIAPVPGLLRRGIVVGLGTDGCASNNSLDMFREMKTAALLQKIGTRDPAALPARNVLEMATIYGAQALGIDCGILGAGRKADIIIVDMKKPHLEPKHDIISNLVYSAVGSDVKTSIVDGKVLMDDYRVLSLDEEGIIEKTEETARDLISRVNVNA